MGCAKEKEKQQSPWEDSRGGSSVALEPEKVGLTSGAVAPKVAPITSVLPVVCSFFPHQTSSGCIEGTKGKLDGAWVSQFVLGMCWEQSRRERIHNYTLLLFNEGRVHLVNFPG